MGAVNGFNHSEWRGFYASAACLQCKVILEPVSQFRWCNYTFTAPLWSIQSLNHLLSECGSGLSGSFMMSHTICEQLKSRKWSFWYHLLILFSVQTQHDLVSSVKHIQRSLAECSHSFEYNESEWGWHYTNVKIHHKRHHYCSSCTINT